MVEKCSCSWVVCCGGFRIGHCIHLTFEKCSCTTDKCIVSFTHFLIIMYCSALRCSSWKCEDLINSATSKAHSHLSLARQQLRFHHLFINVLNLPFSLFSVDECLALSLWFLRICCSFPSTETTWFSHWCNYITFSRSIFENVDLLKDGLPGALVTALILGIHELGHIIVAKEAGIKLGVPYFVPSWQVRIFSFFYINCCNYVIGVFWLRYIYENKYKFVGCKRIKFFSETLNLVLIGNIGSTMVLRGYCFRHCWQYFT